MNENKFTGKAEVYDKARPGYPKAAIDYIGQFFAFGSVCADIGSGTGVLSKELVLAGYDVYAVEPNAEMRKTAEFRMGGASLMFDYHSVDGTAESTTLSSGFADFITVAQALHWFDIDKFKTECARILKPEAKVFVLYNKFEGTLAGKYEQFLKERCPGFKGLGGGDSEDKIMQFFGTNYICENFPSQIVYDKKQFINRALSSS